MSNWLVFSDLDGTFLDAESYDYSPALPLYRQLLHQGIPVIFTTSKTLEEIQDLNAGLDNPHPIVGENGGVLAWSKDYAFTGPFPPGYRPVEIQEISQPNYAGIQAVLDSLRQDFTFKGFHDFTIEALVNLTGLNPEEAQAACQRQVTEPLLWQDSNEKLDHFRQKLNHSDLQLIQGGRFYHVQGHFNKGRALEVLTERYKMATGARPKTVALGDSQNDVPMLEACDFPIVIRRKGVHQISPNHPAVYASRAEGPAGWVEGVQQTPLGAMLVQQ